jgi:hypothetical protein
MCWNEHISLNTFLFSSFVLGLIVYNNTYTQYKIPEFSIFVILFTLSVISMQLVEFFLWRNIKNKAYNHLFSIIGSIVIGIQPIAAAFIIQNNFELSRTLATLYLFTIALISILYASFYTVKIPTTVVSDSGNLHWKWMNEDTYIFHIFIAVWVIFFFTPFFYNAFQDLSFTNYWIYTLLFAAISFIYIFISFSKYGTSSSLWCWVANSIFIFYAFKLLIYLPFIEKNALC